jgi:diguanylate cyclase (GGDEF)-like protein
MLNRNFKINNQKYIILLFIAGILIILFTMKYINNKIEEIKQNEFQKEAISIKKEVQKLQKIKMRDTMAIPIALSYNTLFQKYLEHKINVNLQKTLKKLSFSFRKYTEYKNVWIQVIDKNGVTLGRSWTNKANDSLYKLRKDVRDMIKSPKIMSRINVGKFTLSFKSIVPIFNDKHKFLGMIEVITHFNSIIKKLKKEGIETIVLADKKYKSQLTNNITHTFIDDYYVVNFNPNKDILKLIKEKGVNYFVNDKNYKIYKNYLTTTYLIRDIDGKILGYYILFKQKKFISNETINNFIYAISFFGSLVILIIIFIIIYKNKLNIENQKKYFESILDSTRDIIVVTNLKRVIDANKAFFKFFKVENLDEFCKNYNCICDLFVEENGYLSKKINNNDWIKYVFNNPNIEHKVKILLNDKIYYFSVRVSKLNNENNKLCTVVLSDITQTEVYQKKLEKLSITDALTNIGNREFFNQNIKKEIKRAKRYKTPLSLLMFDLDFFKKVNDTYGHDVGDIVLKEISKEVKSLLRNIDLFCRYGGEEFMVIMPETSLDKAIILAQRIRKSIEKLEIHPVKQITISIGVTELKEDDTIETFIKRVDNALYKSKENGRNRVTSF